MKTNFTHTDVKRIESAIAHLNHQQNFLLDLVGRAREYGNDNDVELAESASFGLGNVLADLYQLTWNARSGERF